MSGGWVVMRRAGALWGVPAAAIAAVERRDGGLRVRLARGGVLDAEGIVALADRLEVRGLPRPARALLPAEARGLAVHGGEPLLVLGEEPEGGACG